MNKNHAKDAIRILDNRQNQREAEITNEAYADAYSSDEEADSSHPIFDSFHNAGGPDAIVRMINFSPCEFREVYSVLEDHILSEWNIGRGRKYSHSPMDVFFMVLAVLKHGGSWDFLAQMFRIKPTTFQRMIIAYMEIISAKAYNSWVSNVSKEYTMSKLVEDETLFDDFAYAIEAIDVTFQQSNRPSENLREGKKYFSGKHKLYGFKVEVAVKPNGLDCAASRHYPRSVADISILQKRIQKTEKRLAKENDADEFEDEYILCEKYPEHWAAIADKGYQGAAEFLRIITPIKKPPRSQLSDSQLGYNKKLASSRIIVENFFGHMGQLWSIVSRKFVWGEELYDTIFYLCVALTNLNVKLQPLRALDGKWYNGYKNRMKEIGHTRKRNRSESQSRYRTKRKLRLGIGFFTSILGSQDSQARETE